MQETYSIDAFDYVDPSPPQPLQRVRTDVVLRDETAILFPSERGQLLDYNQQPGGAEVTALPALPPQTLALTSGRIDLDPDEDVLVAHLRPYGTGGWAFDVSYLERTPAVAWMPVYSRPMPVGLRDVSMAAGDVDADGLDEVVLAFRWSTRINVAVVVIDDLEHGAGVLESHAFTDECGDHLEVALGDLDGDGSDEIVASSIQEDCVAIEVVEASDPSDMFDDYVLRDRYALPAFVRLGEFDDETAGKELLVGFFDLEEDPPWAPLNLQYELVRLDLVDGSLEETGSTRLGDWNEAVASKWVVADTDGDRADEVFLLCDGCVHLVRPDVLLERATWDDGIETIARFDDDVDAVLAAGDEDGDGRDEVFVVGRTELVRIREDPLADALVVTERRDLGVLSEPPTMLVGDFDGDSTVIHYQGGRELVLCEAFPLIVMAAPPWKAGSFQEVEQTTTSYDVPTGSSHRAWSGATLTVTPSFAVDASLLFKRQLLHEFEKTGTAPDIALDVGLSSTGWQADRVLFCGTLYQSYDYQVVADEDPGGIGSVFTIDVPVATRTFFWSVEDYNATFAKQIALGHEVGEPASYMSFAEAMDLQAKYVGWVSPDWTVGEGAGTTRQELSVPFADPRVKTWTTPIDEHVGLRTGPEWGSACLALAADANVHFVSNRTATEFSVTVGDVPWKSYREWGYDFRMLVYTEGHLSAADNTPVGCEPGVLPCQVVTYAVDPWGTGY